MSKEAEIGTLTVVVLKARNLIDKHSFYKQDVFAQAVLNGTSKNTHVDFKGGQHPVWDAELRFPIMKAASDKTRKLEISCFSKERRSDDLLGKGSVDISDTLKTGEFDDWVSLSIDGTVRGDVYLEMTYFSSGPAPAVSSSLTVPPGQGLTRRPSKLSPSERLYRSPQQNPPQSTPNASRRSPGSTPLERPTRPASKSPPQRKNSPLPPLPEPQLGQAALPGILLPGGATRSDPRGSSAGPGVPPSILRPGNKNIAVPTSRSPDHSHRLSVSPSNPGLPRQPSPSDGVRPYTGSLSSNPYLSNPTPLPAASTIPPSITPSVPVADYSPHASLTIPSSTPLVWDQYGTATPMANPSFPVPMVSAPQPNFGQGDPYRSYGRHQTIYNEPPPPQIESYPETRYQSPLSLPPGTEANTLAFIPHARQPELKSDTDRIEALRRAEEAASRKQEQEQRDLELALRLDRELNL